MATVATMYSEPNSLLHGITLQNPDFAAVFDAVLARDARVEYRCLHKNPRYSELAAWSSRAAAENTLLQWVHDHPDECERIRDGGGHFTFGGSTAPSSLLGLGDPAVCDLERYIKFVYVPAFHDAAEDAADAGRNRPALSRLLDIAVKGMLAGSGLYTDLQRDVEAAYEKARRTGSVDSAKGLKGDISDALGLIAGGLRIDLDWNIEKHEDQPPVPSVRIVEDGYSSTIDRTGHGLQRALVIAALGILPRMQGGSAPAAPAPDLPSIVLAIEEPELYQHPTQARHLAHLLSKIAEAGIPGVAGRVQVIYATHSPHFVFPDRIDQIRLVCKSGGGGGLPRETTVAGTASAAILDDLKRRNAARAADGAIDYSLLKAIGPATAKGFFANVVVLTEGQPDRIALMATADAMGLPLDSLGVSVIPCESKSAMPLPIVMFRSLGIPVYAVWDADKNNKKQKEESRPIASALGSAGEQWRGSITESFACLGTDLEATIRADLKKTLGSAGGDDPYDKILRKRRQMHNLGEIGSKPLMTRLVMEEVVENGLRLATLEAIVGQIAKLARGGVPA